MTLRLTLPLHYRSPAPLIMAYGGRRLAFSCAAGDRLRVHLRLTR